MSLPLTFGAGLAQSSYSPLGCSVTGVIGPPPVVSKPPVRDKFRGLQQHPGRRGSVGRQGRDGLRPSRPSEPRTHPPDLGLFA